MSREEQIKREAEERTARTPAPNGIFGADSDSCNQLAGSIDPRRELAYMIDHRVDQLLNQITMLRDARRLAEYAGHETITILRKLNMGGM